MCPVREPTLSRRSEVVGLPSDQPPSRVAAVIR
jgi:hypothetical protein